MANEELTIAKEKARLTVIGNSYPDTLTDSGLGFDLSQIIFDILIDLGFDLPDIDFDDLDDIPVIIGIDPDTEIVTLEYPDPEWEEPEWPDPDISDHDWPEPDWPDNDLPDIISYPMPDLDWDDFIDNLEDLGIDPNILTDLSFTGLDDLGIPTLVSLDEDFNIQMDELPASIEIVTPPNKLECQDGERIDLTGMVVTAKKADGSTWTSAKYPNGHIPLQELVIDPTKTDIGECTRYRQSDLDISPCSNPIVSPGSPVYWMVGTGENIGVEYAEWKYCPGLAHRNGPASYEAIWASSENITYHAKRAITNYDYHRREEIEDEESLYTSYTYKGKTVYYSYSFGSMTGGTIAAAYPDFSGGIGNGKDGLVAWTMIYGDLLKTGTQTVTVSWSRPGDGLILSASFEIEVNELPSGNGGR